MPRYLGVACDNQNAYLAVADNGQILDIRPERITMSSAGGQCERLVGFLADVKRAIVQLQARVLVLVPPDITYEARYSRMVPRIQMETLVLLGAAQVGVTAEAVPRSTLRSRLGLPRAGRFDDHVSFVIPIRVGQYWLNGRGVAAMGALGGLR